LPLGWTKAWRKTGGEQMWIRPGKDIGIGASTGRTEADNLYVFTTSTDFDPETPYSKFAAFTLINFGNLSQNAFQQARKQLMSQGYGHQSEAQAVPHLTPFEPDLDPKLLIDEETGEILESSWQPADLNAYVSGTIITPVPGILHREDHVGLLYNGRVHSFYGESESGKSWVAQWAVAETINQNKNAIYIDFEADASDIVNRLQLLGVPNHNIVTHLTYIKPETRPNEKDPFWQQLLSRTGTELVIIDGVTESLTIWGGETKDNDSITLWMRQFPKRIASRTGAAVVTIDHVNKSTDTRGRFAIGGQAKLAALDGAAYLIEPLDALAPGKVGAIAMRVTKDRPGGIRRHAVNYRKTDRTQEAAIIKMDATGKTINIWVNAPTTKEQQEEIKMQSYDNAIREILADGKALGVNEIKQAYRDLGNTGADDAIVKHLRQGLGAGWLIMNEGKNRKQFYQLAEMGVESA
ncbi:MAG: hypothetical protein EBS30_17560, partial [Planctomycetes bacterium]|nr:hypothetical protein [Planctomycetota bacterium]